MDPLQRYSKMMPFEVIRRADPLLRNPCPKFVCLEGGIISLHCELSRQVKSTKRQDAGQTTPNTIHRYPPQTACSRRTLPSKFTKALVSVQVNRIDLRAFHVRHLSSRRPMVLGTPPCHTAQPRPIQCEGVSKHQGKRVAQGSTNRCSSTHATVFQYKRHALLTPRMHTWRRSATCHASLTARTRAHLSWS
jgi:hypothetical protein